VGWLSQINRLARDTGSRRSDVVRLLVGSALSARKIKSATGGTTVAEIDLATARAFVEIWHYAGNVPGSRNVYFGWFVDRELYAVAVYGIGINQIQHKYLAEVTGLPVKRANLFELKRLCRAEPPRDGFPLSKFIAACHRVLKHQHGIRFIVSFSDPTHNRFERRRKGVPYESGGIYAASNFRWLGKTNAERHAADANGRNVHRRVAYRLMFRSNGSDREKWDSGAMTIADARAKMGLRPRKTFPKDRWFIDLGL
jgi:hypothetical protein